MVGVRDPWTIASIDDVIGWAKPQARERFREGGYELHYNVHGRDGVMGELEPLCDKPGHELCVVVQRIAATRELAKEVCVTGLRQMFYRPAAAGERNAVQIANQAYQ